MDEQNKTNERESSYLAIWQKAVDTQMHFNEMSVKSRQLGLTFVAAALGVGVVLLSRGGDFALTFWLFGRLWTFDVSVLLMLGAIIALTAVRQLDLNVYHRMLRGAVAFGEDFEENYMKKIFDLDKGMTQAISHFSRYSDAKVSPATDSSKYCYTGENHETAEEKIRKFYKRTICFLFLGALAIFLINNFGQASAKSVSKNPVPRKSETVKPANPPRSHKP